MNFIFPKDQNLVIEENNINEDLDKTENLAFSNGSNGSFASDDNTEQIQVPAFVSNVIKTEEIIALENELYNLLLESQMKAKKGLPGRFFKKIKKMKVGFATKQCSVCVCNFENGDIIRKLPCNHIYHENCLKPWLKKHTDCPLCRLDLLEYFSKN